MTVSSTQKSSTASVQAFVKQGKVVSVIAGGSAQTVQAGSASRIDASSSYDEDIFGVAGASAGLQFAWSCIQIAPVLVIGCSGVFKGALSTNSSILAVRARSSAVNYVVQITVTALDATRARSSASSVTLTVVPVTASQVGLELTEIHNVMTGDQVVKLSGLVSVPRNTAVNATWSVDDTSIVDLSAVALSPRQVTFEASAVAFSVSMFMAIQKLYIGVLA